MLATSVFSFSHSVFKSSLFQGCLTHYQMTNFRLFRIADDNLKFDENGRKLSKPVENTMGKGEIACDEQFLLFPQCFQKACFPEASKGVIVWEWVKLWIVWYRVNPVPHTLIFGSSCSAGGKL